ncbi:MAG: hypothetical protein ABDH21_06095 [bacterium]
MRVFGVIFYIICIYLCGCSTNQTEKYELKIGVVDLQKVKLSKTYQQINQKIKSITDELQKNINQKRKHQLKYFLYANLQEKKEKFIQEFNEKLQKAIYYTANQEGIGIVISYDCLPYGGIDITDKVIQNLDNGNYSDQPMHNSVELVAYTDRLIDQKKIEQIIKELYKERRIYVVLSKNDIFLGGFDLNEKLPKQSIPNSTK